LSNELLKLFSDLDRTKVRVRRPSKFIFFCGGRLETEVSAASSLRHYLLKDRKISTRLDAEVILAERANQLYRDTDYHDLITFEEDIAKISAMVLVVAESEGSLAELGAFASNEATRSSLTIIIQELFADTESFIRFGPIERIKRDDGTRVGFYPWRTNKQRNLIKSSIREHVRQIIEFINAGIKRVPTTFSYSSCEDIEQFIVIYWVIYLANAITLGKLTQLVSSLLGPSTQDEVRRSLYCMRLAGWVNLHSYSGQDYYYVLIDIDPFEKYAFLPSAADKDSARRKAEVSLALKLDLALPPYIRKMAAEKRRGSQ